MNNPDYRAAYQTVLENVVKLEEENERLEAENERLRKAVKRARAYLWQADDGKDLDEMLRQAIRSQPE